MCAEIWGKENKRRLSPRNDWSANGLVIKCQFVTIHAWSYKYLTRPAVAAERLARCQEFV
jgi:hypothetical protein